MSKKISKTEKSDHKTQMSEVKAKVDKQVAEAKIDKGLILVLTGDGKGKSSSGLGMVLRSLGHGMKVGVAQFIKGDWETGEKQFLQSHPEVKYHVMGGGFTWNSQDKEADIERTEACWAETQKFLADESLDFLLLDELNVVLSFGYLKLETVLAALKKKPKDLHVVITGRGAPEELLELADTVSTINSPKHAFENGIRAQKGVEF